MIVVFRFYRTSSGESRLRAWGGPSSSECNGHDTPQVQYSSLFGGTHENSRQ